MSTKLRAPILGRYFNAGHVEFHETTYNIFDTNKDAIDAIQLLTAYQTKIKQEDTIYKWLLGSEFTEKKEEVDHERDRIVTGLTNLVHSFELHADPAIRDHAKHIAHLIDNYGHLTHTPYDYETASIDSIVAKLNSNEYRPSAQALQLSSWITELTRLNTLFKEYAVDTEKETGKKPDITMKAARKETDTAMRNIVDRIESLINLNGDYLFKTLVKDFNIHVDHYNDLVHEHYGRLHTKIDITPGEVAHIEIQPYTGEPVFVIPTVNFPKKEKDGTTTMVKLLFAQDFTVGYRNNVGPGAATLIISGIGEYVGDIVTTFNIEAIG
jgi:hypothetical protein